MPARGGSGTYARIPPRGPAFPRRSRSLARDARRRGAPALVGDLCARRRNDTPFIATRESIERSPPSRTNGERDMERAREREGKKRDEFLQDGRNFTLADGDDCDIFLLLLLLLLPPLIPPPTLVCRYVSRLPSASMVLSTLQKSLSTCCLSVSPALYIRECRARISPVATSFYAFNIIEGGITGKSVRGRLIKSCDNQQYI